MFAGQLPELVLNLLPQNASGPWQLCQDGSFVRNGERGYDEHQAMMHRTSLRLFLASLTIFASTPALAANSELTQLDWLAGCWASESGEAGSGEQWTSAAGGAMLGMARTIKRGRMVDFEFMQIRGHDDGRIVFIAQPSGRAPVTFPLVASSADEFTFENPQHDFPQRVVYLRVGEAEMRPRIEGMRNGTQRRIEFPMRRSACDAPAGQAKK